MITHPKDIEYFKNYPAPVLEAVQELHFTNINATIPFFGPMLYFFARAIRATKILEIGHAEGYTGFYLANAVKDTMARHNIKDGQYYGIDIVQTEKVRALMQEYCLPAAITKLDSMDLSLETFPEVKFDIIFQDGAHDADHVLYEMETMYPQLDGNGQGYWIAHDVFGPAEEGFREIKRRIDCGIYDFEYIRIFEIYGIAIMRKMTGWDESIKRWKG